MKCLHGQPAVQKGSFWFCNQSYETSCHFFCSVDEAYLFEKAIAAWKSTNQSHPRCCGHRKLAQMCVVNDSMKPSYGRPFFVCSNKSKACLFWAWGDVQPLATQKCHHGFPCVISKVKKEGLNKDCLFFGCPQKNSCRYFEWVPEEQGHVPYHCSSFKESSEGYLPKEFIDNFANCLNI